MSNDHGVGPNRRDDLYARTMHRADELATSRRRRQRLLVTLPAGLLVLALTGGVMAAVVSTGASGKTGHVHPAGGSVPTTTAPTGSTGSGPSTTTTTPTTNPPAITYVGFAPQSFTAVSLDHWWVLGSNCDSSTSTCPVLETTDGGQSFQKLSAPDEPLSSSDSPGIRFANASDGFVFGPKLFATTDGGKTWVPQDLHGEVTDLEAADGQAFALSCTGTSCSLYSEQVGSGAWTEVSLPSSLPAHCRLYVSGSRVVVTEGVSNSPAPVSFLISTDGGASFVSRESPCFRGLGGVVIPAINQSDALWAACPTGMQATAFVSSDNGQTWTKAGGQQCGQGSSGSCVPGFSNGLSLAPVSASVALAWPADNSAGIALTTDGGTIYQVTFNGSANDLVTWVGYSDANRAYGILTGSNGTNGSLVESNDGGQSWQEVSFKS